MIVSCPFDAELSTELTERELAAEVSRSDRLLAAAFTAEAVCATDYRSHCSCDGAVRRP